MGEPRPRTKTYRRFVVAISVTRGRRFVREVVDLSTLPNGDWEDYTLVEIRVPVGTPYCSETLIVTVAERMVRALLPGVMTIVSKDCFTLPIMEP